MNISNSTGTTQATLDTQAAALGSDSKAEALKKSTADQAPLTPVQKDAMHLSAAAGILSPSNATAEVSSERVAGLQAAIANGTYSVSSSDLAGKLIDSLIR